MPSIPDDPITFTCALEARRETVYFLAKQGHDAIDSAPELLASELAGFFRY